jgi:hypothetical protein
MALLSGVKIPLVARSQFDRPSLSCCATQWHALQLAGLSLSCRCVCSAAVFGLICGGGLRTTGTADLLCSDQSITLTRLSLVGLSDRSAKKCLALPA